MERILGIHILAPAEVTQAIQRARQYVPRYFGSQVFSPHVTLYLARYRASAFRKLVKRLTRDGLPSSRVTIGELSVYQQPDGSTFVELEVRPTVSLLRQHRWVVQRANALRQGLIRFKDRRRILQGVYTKVEAQRIKRYGYSAALPAFSPHLTIGVVNGQVSATVVKELKKILVPFRGFSWTPDDMVVGLYDYDTKRERYFGKPRESLVTLKLQKRRAK